MRNLASAFQALSSVWGVRTQACGLGYPPVGPSGLRVCAVRRQKFAVRFEGSRGWTLMLSHRDEILENTLDGRPYRPL